ncbi:MAG: helix-turn-helix transcriptional regulator [Candidatus Lokiarchaeota archaeon]|nr:helix-turn-helix transcriptional regulator [Candidatus Lokiarchaeota archaeon]
MKELSKKGLIEIYQQQEDMGARKVYNITQKGKGSLDLILEKQICIEDSIETFRITMSNKNNLNYLINHDPFSFFLQRLMRNQIRKN